MIRKITVIVASGDADTQWRRIRKSTEPRAEHPTEQEWMLDRFHFAAANDKKLKDYRFWQEGNHVEQLHTGTFFFQKLNYLHQNPVRKEIVAKAEDYLYSSARDYAGMKGLLDVIVVR